MQVVLCECNGYTHSKYNVSRRTSENVKMEKHCTRRGLNLNLCASKALVTAETSIITGSSESKRFWSAELDVLPCEVRSTDSSFGTSWLVKVPAFFNTSIIVGCLSFPLVSELEALDIFLRLLFFFGDVLSCVLLCSFFSTCPIWLGWFRSGGPKWST